MPNSVLPSLLFKINENQLSLEAAVMELSNWVEQRGSVDVADKVRGALDTIDKNEEVLMTPECPAHVYQRQSLHPPVPLMVGRLHRTSCTLGNGNCFDPSTSCCIPPQRLHHTEPFKMDQL
ncbi:hypothetical protein J3D54_005288 [Pseudomonas sp. GGS8]|nr:hypothetical protein [Pseudomonas sp. GGS8]